MRVAEGHPKGHGMDTSCSVASSMHAGGLDETHFIICGMLV